MEITREQLDVLVDNIQDMLQDDLELRTDYSGRGMYGKACVGFVSNNSTKVHGVICAVLATWEAEHNSSAVTWYDGLMWSDLNPQTDSMGRSSILYYSNLQLTD